MKQRIPRHPLHRQLNLKMYKRTGNKGQLSDPVKINNKTANIIIISSVAIKILRLLEDHCHWNKSGGSIQKLDF